MALIINYWIGVQLDYNNLKIPAGCPTVSCLQLGPFNRFKNILSKKNTFTLINLQRNDPFIYDWIERWFTYILQFNCPFSPHVLIVLACLHFGLGREWVWFGEIAQTNPKIFRNITMGNGGPQREVQQPDTATKFNLGS